MSFNNSPYGGYSPYPQNPAPGGGGGASAPGLGFSKPGEGSGYPLYPQAGGGPSYPQSQNPYQPPSAPGYPPQGNSSYPSQSGPYPQTNASPYLQTSSSPYPAPGGGGSYPTAGTSTYPPAGGPGYPAGGSPYPLPGGSSPYAPAGGASAYPGAAAYPPQGGGSNPYPQAGGGFPMPSQNQTSYPSATSNSPYPSYPSAAGGPPASYPPSGVSPYGPPSTYSSISSGGPIPGGSVPGASGGVLYPYRERPTIRPAMSFDPSGDSAVLKKAMKGMGTDEKAIIQVLARRTSVQRQQIMVKYQQSYGKDLIKDLKSELSGNLEKVILALMTPLPVYLANEINRAISGMGTKESTLIEVLCTRDNNSIREIKGAYYNIYHVQLEKHIAGDTSGGFQRILISMATGARDEQNCDPSLAPQLAQSLYKAGEGKWGTDNSEFNRIMSSYSYPVLRCVFAEYHKIKGHTFEQAIKSELSGDVEDAMLAIYNCINNRAGYFAAQLHAAMKGMGTKDEALIRLIISRCEIDLGNIKDEYVKTYGRRLEDAVASETSGDYKKVLLAIMQD